MTPTAEVSHVPSPNGTMALEAELRQALLRRLLTRRSARTDRDVEVGRVLLQVRHARRGRFLAWLDQFGLSRRSAQRLMQLAERVNAPTPDLSAAVKDVRDSRRRRVA